MADTLKTQVRVVLGLAALAALVSGISSAAKPPVAPVISPNWPQNWNYEQRYQWYTASQGSRLIPESWLFALETKGASTLFMDPANFAKYNYLSGQVVADVRARAAAAGGKTKPPCQSSAANDPRLPLGFARDCQSDKNLNPLVSRLRWFAAQKDKENWIGLNCAACHTNQIMIGGQPVIVDGAPALSDFQSFTDDLLASMEETFATPAKWDAFVKRVIAPRSAKEKDNSRFDKDAKMLRKAFEALRAQQRTLATYNRTDSVYGHARLDAVGHILNKVSWLNQDPKPIRGEPNAAVSYPFIWNANQHDFVQWDGLVPNKHFKVLRGNIKAGALVRNTSEVIGVFADVTLRRDAGLNGYESSVAVTNLLAMENQLATLTSPAWPAAFGTPDLVKVDLGRRLFRESCKGCHDDLARDDLTTPIIAQMTPVWGVAGLGTDPMMACNTFAYQARGGLLAGTKDLTGETPGDHKLPEIGQTAQYLKTQALGSLLRKKATVIWDVLKEALGKETGFPDYTDESAGEQGPVGEQPLNLAQRMKLCQDMAASPSTNPEILRILAYKGRPINGIWATAPYLHNGSVRTLYDLLLKPADRPTRFWVGSSEFDPKHVGFVGTPGPVGSWFSTKGADGKPLIGNSNLGHDYGNSRFSEADRLALVEYMKTL